VTMPKTSVYKYHCFVPSQYDVWRARKGGVNSKSETKTVKETSHDNFWSSVLLADRSHQV